MKEQKTIRVCDDCGVPLIWTFAFDGCERYCLNCGSMGGMLGTGKDVPATRELVFQKKLVDSVWKVIYGNKGFIPNGRFGRSGCNKDNKGGYSSSCNDHRQHLTVAEKEWDEIARKYLVSLKGMFTTSPNH